MFGAIRDDQWSAPTPCADWCVRDVLNHLVGGNWGFVPVLTGRPHPDHAANQLGAEATVTLPARTVPGAWKTANPPSSMICGQPRRRQKSRSSAKSPAQGDQTSERWLSAMWPHCALQQKRG